MHLTIINRTNNRYGQQYGFSIPSMVPILTQWFYYFVNSNTPPQVMSMLLLCLQVTHPSKIFFGFSYYSHYAQLVRFCMRRLHCPSNPIILPQVQSFSCPRSCARLFCMLKRIDIPSSSIQRVTIQFNPAFNQSGSQTCCPFVFVSVHHTHIIIIIMCY